MINFSIILILKKQKYVTKSDVYLTSKRSDKPLAVFTAFWWQQNKATTCQQILFHNNEVEGRTRFTGSCLCTQITVIIALMASNFILRKFYEFKQFNEQ